MSRFLSWIDSKYNKKVNPGIILTFFILGTCLQYVSPIMQVILLILISIIMLLFMISSIKQQKRKSEIIMITAIFIGLIFYIISRVMYNKSLFTMISLVSGALCIIIVFIAAIRNAFESGDDVRIRKVKVGIIFLIIATLCFSGVVLVELLG